MDKVLYAQLVCLLDIYEEYKKHCVTQANYIYYSGACDALKKLKGKIESYEAERIK